MNIIQHISSEPCVIRDGVFGASFKQNGEILYLRMELVTEENALGWTLFKNISSWIANSNGRGVLSGLVSLAGKKGYPTFNEIRNVTQFTEQEFTEFTKKCIELKQKTNNVIVELLKATSVGSNHIFTGINDYIVYITTDANFSIRDINTTQEFSLKNYINSYQKIIIVMGSNFNDKKYFSNRGIFRNPYWVFQQKYSGLSMLLHGFVAVIANKYFLEKEHLRVKPVGSMQSIIQKHLYRGEGYIIQGDKNIDIVDIQVTPDDPEGSLNYIQINALLRIYNQFSQQK